ncbi:MAG: hypothetical protein V1754_05290, partial [Pseudomonadota bacterium]
AGGPEGSTKERDPAVRKRVIQETDLRQKAMELAKEVSQIRGLKLKREIKIGVMNREQILELIKVRLGEEYEEKDLLLEGAILKQLGLLPPSLDFKNAFLELLTDQVAGFYDPKERKLNIADWLPIDIQMPALAHEICHALQDQNFSIKRFIKPVKDNSDLQLANISFVEGDCTGLMLEYILKPIGKDLGSIGPMLDSLMSMALSSVQSTKFASSPMFLRETLISPYRYGLAFVVQLRSQNPWSQIDKIFLRPPQSTEQILHYDKYWQREHPVRIRAKTLPALAEYKKAKVDTLGELQLKIYLQQGVDEDLASQAAAGWGGDLLVAFEPLQAPKENELPLLVHLSTWDSEADAVEFTNAQCRVLTKRFGKSVTSGANSWSYTDSEQKKSYVQRYEKHVLTIFGVPSSIDQNLPKQIWRLWQIEGKRLKMAPSMM